MSHHHEHQHNHNHQHGSGHVHGLSKNLWVAFVLNAFFTILEFIGGFFTNSMAILSDAVHDLGDTAAIGCALFLEHLASKHSDSRFSYGYRRLSPLGGFITTSILIIGSILILIESIPRIISPEPVNAEGMIGFAILGILVNGFAAYKLKSDAHAINSRAVMLHMLEDVLGWAAVLVGSITIYFFNWYFIDGYLSVAIAIFIGYNAFKNGKELSIVFLQGVPSSVMFSEIEELLRSHNSITEVKNLRIWTLDGEQHVLTVEIVTSNTDYQSIEVLKTQLKQLLLNQNISDVTIETTSMIDL